MAKLFQITETKIDSTTHLVPKVKLLSADYVQEVVDFGSGSIIRLRDDNNISKVTERVVTEDKASVLALMDGAQGSVKALSLLVLSDGGGDVDSIVKLIPVDYILEVESDTLNALNSIVTLTNISSSKGKKYTVQETVANILTASNATSGGGGGDLLSTNNLSDVTNAVTSLSNLGGVRNTARNLSSTQWSKTLASPVTFDNGAYANGFTFFAATDKVTGGTTSYNEFNIQFGIEIELSGTSGTANVSVNGTTYLLTFGSNLNTTAANFITSHETALNADNVRVFNLDADTTSPFGNKNARLRFCTTEAINNGISITNVTGDVAGTITNPFTGLSVAANDHCLVPYSAEPYAGQRLHHTFRVNFGIDTGNVQTYGLSLRRYADDSIIASEIPIIRSSDVEGQQITFASYTAGSTDPFVLGGFYFALRNNSGSGAAITGGVGILVQNEFEKPVTF